MIKKLKANKIIVILLISVCFIFILNPEIYSKSCFDAIGVWATKVLPVLLPFFILTRLIVELSEMNAGRMDKYFNKAYNVPSCGFKLFLLSIISGYPMGAKLIANMYEKNKIDSTDAKKLMSFTSISGPMFIVGTVGLKIFGSFKAGIIMLIANIIACLINGLLYRKDRNKNHTVQYQSTSAKQNILSDCIYDSLVSILMVAGYIVVSFLLIDILKNTDIFNVLSNTICSVFHMNNSQDIITAIMSGMIEITRGSIELSNANVSLNTMTIVGSTMIAFGGVSIIMQSLGFISRIHLPVKSIILQKTTQAIICLIITSVLVVLFL